MRVATTWNASKEVAARLLITVRYVKHFLIEYGGVGTIALTMAHLLHEQQP